MTSNIGNEVKIYAEIPILGKYCQISCALMETITKASIRELDHLMNVFTGSFEISEGILKEPK